MNIVMLLYKYFPIDSRVKREAKTLAQEGHDVTVVDLDSGNDQQSRVDGVERVSLLQVSPQRRNALIPMLSFWISALHYLVRSRKRIDVVHAHDLTALPPACAYVLRNRSTKLVYDSHELFPEAALDKLTYFHYVFFLCLELLCGLFVDHIISVSPIILNALSKRISAPRNLVMNVPDVEEIESKLGPIPLWKGGLGANIRIAYSGQVLKQRGYEEIVEAAILMKDMKVEPFLFYIIGGGPFLQALVELTQVNGVDDCFHFTGTVNYEDLLELTSNCDIALALYESTRNNNAGLSNKLFEYMAIGIPFIYTDLSQTMPILEKVGAYVIRNPYTPQDIVNAIETLRHDFARRSRIARLAPNMVKSVFNWSEASKNLISIYDELQIEFT